MSERPYQLPRHATNSVELAFAPQGAGFGSRLFAFLIDTLPITFAMAAVFYFYFGFDETYQAYVNNRNDLRAREAFVSQRSTIRNLSCLIYIGYCIIAECSPMQGTIGKRLLGMRVTDDDGHRITAIRSLKRNAAKIASAIPLGLGFVWAIWSKQSRSWHDICTKTMVATSKSISKREGKLR